MCKEVVCMYMGVHAYGVVCMYVCVPIVRGMGRTGLPSCTVCPGPLALIAGLLDRHDFYFTQPH